MSLAFFFFLGISTQYHVTAVAVAVSLMHYQYWF